MQKEHTKSLNKCFMNICWKKDCRTNREKRNCSSFKKVLEREIYSFVAMFIFSAYTMYNKTIIGSVFVICGIINVSVRQITLTETLIIPHITKTSSNNCLLLFAIIIFASLCIRRTSCSNWRLGCG